jgi:hypothetical protein
VLAPVLQASGLKYSKQYYLDRFDLNDDDLEDVEWFETSTLDSNVMPTKDRMDDDGERKEPTRDRSIVDED